MTRTDEKLEMIRLRMEFGVWLRERSNITLKSGLGEFLFLRWLKGQCIRLNTKDVISVTFPKLK